MSGRPESPARVVRSPDHDILAIARRPTVVRRALRYAVIVGTILLAINHSDAIMSGHIPTARLLRMMLTVLVPYCVSTASSVEAIRSMERTQLTG